MWDYAQLTKTAAEYGGPDKYIDAIKAFAHAEGCASGFIKGAGIVTLISVPVCAAIAKFYADYQVKKEEANRAKQALSNYLQMEEKMEESWEKNHDEI